MNNQEAFDTMVTHLFTQKVHARDLITGACVYRADTGLKCAVGALIPDDEYDEDEFEGSPISNIIYNIPSLVHLNVDMLTRVQCIHDEYAPSDWFRELLNVPSLFKLDNTTLKTFKGIEL